MDFEKPRPVASQMSDNINNLSNSISEGYKQASTSVSDTLSEFSSKTASPGATPEFLQSNSIVAKFAFIIFVLILFFILLGLGIKLLMKLLGPSDSPFLIKGTSNGTDNKTIFTDPHVSGSIPIVKSNNQSTGMEFTWSVWLLVNDINVSNSQQYKNVFNKGNAQYDSKGIATVNNGPGLYIDNANKQLHIVMDTVTGQPPLSIDVPNIPLKKWFHVAIRLENTAFDVYVNGVITNRLILQHTPKQNYQDVNICANGGFAGMLADLRYYNHALSVFDILSIVNYGRNSNMTGSDDSSNYPFYLSNSWYTRK
jgi:hypothetical protein